MYGVFKKLNANDIKITPFEAHKQYDITGSDLASNGIVTSSLYWSPDNKSTFSSESLKYYQIDNLYYRDYPRNAAHLLELDDVAYKKQTRYLYETASVISIPQSSFGNGILPGSVTINFRKGRVVDDGFGNLVDSTSTVSSIEQDAKVLDINPVWAFKYKDLTIDPTTGNKRVNAPSALNGTFYDESYHNNVVTYKNIIFGSGGFDHPNLRANHTIGTLSILPYDSSSRIEIKNQPYLNFDDDDFAISFLMYQSGALDSFRYEGQGNKYYILTKEGAINTPTNVIENNLGSNTPTTTKPGTGKFPYRIYLEATGSVGSANMVFERSDGNITTRILRQAWSAPADQEFVHYTFMKTGSELSMYRNGSKVGVSVTDKTVGSCSNENDIVIFSQRNNDGSYFTPPTGSTNSHAHIAPLQNIKIFNRGLTTLELAQLGNEAGAQPGPSNHRGNIFYDNGFCVITYPHNEEGTNTTIVKNIEFKNTYPITEYEYQCTVKEQEYNYTNNLSVRKVPNTLNGEFKSFVTSSDFKPYVTTIGLYDDNNNLLAVGKLGQPIKMSEETDTTFVIRFDK